MKMRMKMLMKMKMGTLELFILLMTFREAEEE